MNAIELVKGWPGPLALWPSKHANYLLPVMYEPWDLVPEWLSELISQSDNKRFIRQCVKAAGVNGLDDLNIYQAVSLLDVLLEQIRRTRATGEADHLSESQTHLVGTSNQTATDRLTVDEQADARVVIGRWRPRRRLAPLATQVV